MAASKPLEKEASERMEILLNGHLFDSGLINTILDEAEHLDCRFQIKNCRVDRGTGHAKDDVVPTQKSTALVQFTSESQGNLNMLETKILALVEVMDKADASMKVVDRSTTKGSCRAQHNASGMAKIESQEEQKVLVLGAGRVSASLVDYMGRTPQTLIHIASDNEQEAADVASRAKRGMYTAMDLCNPKNLASLIKNQHVVISLLPASLHTMAAEECIRQKKHFVTASYESSEMREMNQRAKEAGIIIMNEVGLDPGLDHMSAMKIIDDIHDRGGSVKSFQSVCGGLPAPEAADNPLKYKFSWSPRGVISASQNTARYRKNGKIVEIPGSHLMRSAAVFDDDVWPDMALECLPNRDSLKYESIYNIANAETIFRGTLRYRGFSDLMSVFQQMGFFELSSIDGRTWSEALINLGKKAGEFASLHDFVQHCAGGDKVKAQAAMDAMHWLGMDGDFPVSNPESRVDSLCAVLESSLQYGEEERDMVAMHTCIEASFPDGSVELHKSSLLKFGDSSVSAMCRTVGLPAAAAANLVLSGDLKDYTGLVLPTDKRVYLPILTAVEKEGISFDETVTAIHPPS